MVKSINYATMIDILENEILTWQYHMANDTNDKIRGEQHKCWSPCEDKDNNVC